MSVGNMVKLAHSLTSGIVEMKVYSFPLRNQRITNYLSGRRTIF